MADWKFDLLITQAASVEYERLKMIAETAVCLRPLPVNSDARVKASLGAVHHYERTRRILQSIRNPRDVGLDMSLLGVRYFVKYRCDLGTCVYFTRIVESLSVLVYHFSDSPLDYDALQKVIVSGNAHLLPRIGLPFPDTRPSSLTVQ